MVKLFSRYPGMVALILTSICLVPQTILLLVIVYKNRKLCKTKSIIIAQCVAIFNECYILWIFWLSIYGVSKSYTTTFDASICFYYFNAAIWLLLSRLTIYLFYIVRLHEIFHTTAWSYKPSLLIAIFILFLLLWFAAVGPMIYLVDNTVNKFNNISDTEYSHIISFEQCSDLFNIAGYNSSIFVQINAMGVLFSEIICSIVILRLYLRKLIKLSLTFEDRITVESIGGKQNAMEKRKSKFARLAIRITNTLILAVSSTLIIIGSNGLAQYWMAIDCVINTLAIYFSFSFGDYLYNKTCCCQSQCYTCCVWFCYCTRLKMT
eukprot:406349_1